MVYYIGSPPILVPCLSRLSGEHQTYSQQPSCHQKHRLQLHPGGPRGLRRGQLQQVDAADLLRLVAALLRRQHQLLPHPRQPPEHSVGLQKYCPVLNSGATKETEGYTGCPTIEFSLCFACFFSFQSLYRRSFYHFTTAQET